MKFVMSYSCGKDSTLCLHKMLEQGHELVAILTTLNKDVKRSWFHGVNSDMLKQISKSFGTKLIFCPCEPSTYNEDFEKGLLQAKEMGAEVCCFGDIDIVDHFEWGKSRCENAGVGYLYPLWQEDRRKITNEVIDLGYKACIKCVNPKKLDNSFLGKDLTHELVDEIVACGSDACGEYGEYHTLVYDGPIFKQKINIEFGKTLSGQYANYIDIKLKK